MRYEINVDDRLFVRGSTPSVPIDDDIIVVPIHLVDDDNYNLNFDERVFRVIRRQFYVNTDGDIDSVTLYCEDFDQRGR
jgi:hypothetical protein